MRNLLAGGAKCSAFFGLIASSTVRHDTSTHYDPAASLGLAVCAATLLFSLGTVTRIRAVNVQSAAPVLLILGGHKAAEHAHVADARAQLVERRGDMCLGHVPVELHEEDVDTPLLVAVGVRLDEGQVDSVAVEGRQRRREPARLDADEMDM